MTPVLTADAMRSADRYTIDEFGISGFTLMESAGRGGATRIDEVFGPLANRLVAVYCGKGNNGGDGFVVARVLFERGARLRVVFLGEEREMSPDAARHFELLRMLGRHDADGRLTILPFEDLEALRALPAPEVHVDALLGTGLTSALRTPFLDLVRWLNEQSGAKVALDVPTGLHTNLGKPLGAAFRADLTLTMAARKTGLCLNAGPSLCGRTEVLEIGIPSHTLRIPADAGDPGCAFLSSDEAVRSGLPVRGFDANKYGVGLALVVGGSAGMTGAPVMASSAAARVGAGYVVCASDHGIHSVLATKLTEVTTIALPTGADGIEAGGAMQALSERLGKVRGALIGCGLGRAPGTQAFVRRFLEEVEAPVVVDADGLYALGGHTATLSERAQGRWILTPHMGEFKRLVGDVPVDPDDRVRLAQHFARTWNCVLLLKGLPSVVAGPDGRAWINSTGNPALASAGTGDVLAGMCAGLLAQGIEPVQAAVAALHIGGAAADRYAAQFDGRSMQATDLITELPAVMRERFQSQPHDS